VQVLSVQVEVQWKVEPPCILKINFIDVQFAYNKTHPLGVDI
jgi:hypothetical protein